MLYLVIDSFSVNYVFFLQFHKKYYDYSTSSTAQFSAKVQALLEAHNKSDIFLTLIFYSVFCSCLLYRHIYIIFVLALVIAFFL
jgi:hypothetical protein